jgi:hypothetical protein
MDNPLVLQIVGGLVAIFFIFLLVMCWKSWRFTHIFFSFLVFAGAAAFLWIASMSLKTHNAWRTLYEGYTKEIKKAEAENQQYIHGDLNEVEQTDASFGSLQAELDRSLVERGRVWRECTPSRPTNQDPASFTIQVRTVPASLPQGTTPVPNGIINKTVLYAFAEAENDDGWRVPAAYLGEFSVTNATPTDVVLQAMLPLLPDQVQRITQGGTTWALYEIMPLDGHEILAEMDETEKRMVGLDKTELTRYIPNPGLPQDKYDAIIESFHRFNREATEDDPPENTWMMVKFVKAHSIQVDSDAEQSLLEPDGRYFDTSGRAVEGRVRHGEEGTVEFEVGDTGIFDLDTADTLIADGVAEKVKLIYRRDLHDYGRFFADARLRHNELDDSIARAQRELDTYVALKAKVDADILVYNDEKVKLERDLEGFRRELADATAYAQALDVQWQKTLKELSDLYRANNQLVDELTRLQSQMAQEIQRRTAEATARASTTTSSQ